MNIGHHLCGLRASFRLSAKRGRGFTLIELLIVIAIIGILSALIITTVSNAAQDARTVVARQQQITLQDALNAWIAANSSGTNTLQNARTAYSGAATASAKLVLLKDYLHPETYSHLTNYSSSDQIKSDAMVKAGVNLQFSSWAATNTPVVEWHTN
jgi:prepilin-type N-terminal cleavage/methylation domain-containing protein